MSFFKKIRESKTFRMVLIAEFGALSILLAKFTRFPIFAAAPFLKMDLGEIPLLLAAMVLPGFSGLTALLVKEMLSFLIFGTNLYSLTADFLACGCFLLVFTLLRRRELSLRRFVVATTVAAVARMAFSIPLNLVILQLQYGSSIETIWAQMPFIVPFNGLKCVLDAVCIVPLYHRLTTMITASAVALAQGDDNQLNERENI